MADTTNRAEQLARALNVTRQQRDTLLATIRAARDLHTPTGRGRCTECGFPYPCETLTRLAKGTNP